MEYVGPYMGLCVHWYMYIHATRLRGGRWLTHFPDNVFAVHMFKNWVALYFLYSSDYSLDQMGEIWQKCFLFRPGNPYMNDIECRNHHNLNSVYAVHTAIQHTSVFIILNHAYITRQELRKNDDWWIISTHI